MSITVIFEAFTVMLLKIQLFLDITVSLSKLLLKFQSVIVTSFLGPSRPGHFVDCWTLKMKKLQFFETSVTIYHTTWHNIPEDM